MKKTVLILFVLISLTISAQQSSIIGEVSIINSQTETGKRQYVSNAQVEDKQREATPTTTDASGNFKLIFVGVPEKTSIRLVNGSLRKHEKGEKKSVYLWVTTPKKYTQWKEQNNPFVQM